MQNIRKPKQKTFKEEVDKALEDYRKHLEQAHKEKHKRENPY